MKTNLFRCIAPGQAGQMALRYLFSNVKEDKELAELAYSLLDTITGVDHKEQELSIVRIWPEPIFDVGLEVLVRYKDDLYHISFFFFEYGYEDDMLEDMTSSTSYLRGDGESKGDYFVIWRPEDLTNSFYCPLELPTGCAGIAYANGRFAQGFFKNRSCSNPLFREYIDYINENASVMFNEPTESNWLSGIIGFENYVERRISPALRRELGKGFIASFRRINQHNGEIYVSIETGFDVNDMRGFPVTSWLDLRLSIEMSRRFLKVDVVGDCVCWEDTEHWIPGEELPEIFYRMRKTFDQEGSEFTYAGGGAEPGSLVAKYKDSGILLEKSGIWFDNLPNEVVRLAKHILDLLSKMGKRDN